MGMYGASADYLRHFSHLYGLYTGNVLSAERNPEFTVVCKIVLNHLG